MKRRMQVLAAGAVTLTLSFAGALPARAATPPLARDSASGTVSTLFAGSLLNYMEHNFGPSFTKATGTGYKGFGGGSTEVANQIKGGVRQGDVFISAAS
ncbi:MAG TPA: hypothetical protein VMB05_18295, partial [Solirubrobacteraceae bacterium]|nr:hypothetical protein [Solirubrobacteraceae bacterium]